MRVLILHKVQIYCSMTLTFIDTNIRGNNYAIPLHRQLYSHAGFKAVIKEFLLGRILYNCRLEICFQISSHLSLLYISTSVIFTSPKSPKVLTIPLQSCISYLPLIITLSAGSFLFEVLLSLLQGAWNI